jgi:four helix bundle protein
LTIVAKAIQIKSREFAIRIVGCYKFLVEQRNEYVMSKQLLRCGTSIGANTRESKNAQSRMDFLNKLNIALKEADETEYWLDLLHATNYLDDTLYESINSDCAELIKLLTSIIKKLKETSDKN